MSKFEDVEILCEFTPEHEPNKICSNLAVHFYVIFSMRKIYKRCETHLYHNTKHRTHMTKEECIIRQVHD